MTNPERGGAFLTYDVLVQVKRWMWNTLSTGQFISYEVVDATASSCPVELVKIPVPDSDSEFRENSSSAQRPMFPFLRSAYNSETGNAPNRPRQPVYSYEIIFSRQNFANV